MINCGMINFRKIKDGRGDLTFIQYPDHIPFEIKRIYYIYNVKEEVERGFHSHKKLHQILIALNGSIKIKVKSYNEEETVELSDPAKGLYIGPMIWREMYDFSPGAVLLVLASNVYDESDYIRDYEKFLKDSKVYFNKED